jgi:hypothetical protein
VTFSLVHAAPADRQTQSHASAEELAASLSPRVTGSRAALCVQLPVPEAVFSMLPSCSSKSRENK